jgi:hypothetical protein
MARLWDKIKGTPPPNAEALLKERRETPALYSYYTNAMTKGLLDEQGRVTGRGISLTLTRDRQALVHEGTVEDKDNVAKAFVDGLNRGGQNVLAGYANTMGFDSSAKAIRHRMDLDAELSSPNFREHPVNSFFDLLGMGVAEFAGPVIATAVTGQPLAGIAATYTRLWGDNLDLINDTAPHLTPFEATAINSMLTGFQAGIEHGFGLERRIAGLINKNIDPVNGLAKFIRTKEGQGVLRRYASEFFDPSNPLTGAISGAVKETFEETAQAAGEIMTTTALGGDIPDRETMIQRLFYEPLQAIPAGMVFGAFTYSRNAARASIAPVAVPTPEEVVTMHTDPETGQVDMESVAAEDAAFNALERGLRKIKGVKNPTSTTQVIRAMTWAFARAGRALGQDVMPADFIENLKTAFINDNFEAADIEALENTINDPNLDPLQKTNAILKMLAQRAGEDSQVYRQMRDIHQEMEASILDEMSEQLQPYIRSLVPALRDSEARKAFTGRVVPVIQRLVGNKDSAVFKMIRAGKTVGFSIEQVSRMELPEDVYARLTVEPQTMTINGRRVQVSARSGFVSVTTLKHEQVLDEEIVQKRAEAEAELRQRREEQGKQQPLTEVIQSDFRLGVARQKAFDIFGKYRAMTDELETYRKRINTKPRSEPKALNIPRFTRTYTANDIINEMSQLMENLPTPVKTSYETKAAQMEARRQASIATGAQSRMAVDIDADGWETQADDDGFPQDFAETEYQASERKRLKTLIKPDTGGRHVAGRKITKPSRTYEEGKTKRRGNVWVRQTPRKSNKGRVLLVQFSNRVINPRGTESTVDEEYYDNLYAKRKGYVRQDDFWEAPLWAATAAYSLDNADFYVIRDMDEAKRFFKEAGYDEVWFSAVEVNKKMITDLAESVPEQQMVVGGYVDEGIFTQENLTYQESIQKAVEALGQEYKRGTDYRHLNGTAVIPRLVMSHGCLHQCAFCTVPKQIKAVPLELIDQQVESFKALKSNLVYLNDKTFGQSPNYKYLPEIYRRIKEYNPDFEGFIVQTTTSAIMRLSPEFLKESGIKFVELGIETVNDPILRKNRKPSSVKLSNQSAHILRKAGVTLIPNIIIGLPEETAETYANTLDWLEQNRDIISHLNIYNLAVYQGTQLAADMQDQGLVDSDFDENVREKSFHKDHQIHVDFAEDLYEFANSVLETQPYADQRRTGPRSPLTSVVGTAGAVVPEGLGKAKQMQKEGANPIRILKETGWRFDKDGHWKFEISDKDLKLNTKLMKEALQMKIAALGPLVAQGKLEIDAGGDGITIGKLQNFLDHPTLFEVYPSLKFIDIKIVTMAPQAQAAFNPAFDEILINSKFFLPPTTAEEQHAYFTWGSELKPSILMHEIQHAIQGREQFAAGSSPADAAPIHDAVKDVLEKELAGIVFAQTLLLNNPKLVNELRYILKGPKKDEAAISSFKSRFAAAIANAESPVMQSERFKEYFESAKKVLGTEEGAVQVAHVLATLSPTQIVTSMTRMLNWPATTMDTYVRSHGEAEANMVMNRVNLSQEELTDLEHLWPKKYPYPSGGTWVLTDSEMHKEISAKMDYDAKGIQILIKLEDPIDNSQVIRPLFNKHGAELHGLYLPQNNMAVFFANANEATVLHEFLHHARAMLPQEVQQAIIQEFDVDARGIWTTHIEERFVDSILTYIRDGNLNVNPSFNKAIEDIIPILKHMVSLNEVRLDPALKEKLDNLFAPVVESDLHAVQAEAAQAAMEQEGPTAEQVMDTEKTAALTDLEIVTPKKTGRNALYAKIFAIASKVAPDSSALVHHVASEVFPWFTDGSSLTELSEQELTRLAVEMHRRYDQRVTTEAAPAAEALDDLLTYEATKKDVHQDRRIRYTTRGRERAYSWLNNLRNLIDKHDIHFTSPKFLAVILDDYANDGAWHRHYADPIDNMQHEAAKALHRIGAYLHRMTRKYSLDLDAVADKRVNLDGYTATIGRAVLLTLADQTVNGEISNAKKAIMESNDVSEQEFIDARNAVASDPDAQSLMAYLKEAYAYLYDEIDPVYTKVTGEHLGKVPNYFALLRVDGMFAKDDTLGRALEYVNQYGQSKAASRYSMTKERQAIKSGRIDLDHALSGLRHYTTQAANYVAKAEEVQQMGQMINSEQLQEALIASYGRERGSVMHDMLRSMLAREMFPNARTEIMSDHDRFFAWSRQAFTMSMLGFRPMVWLAQLVSKPTFYAMLKGGLSPSTMMADLNNTQELIRIIISNEFENGRRGRDGSYKDKGYIHWLEGSRLLWTDGNGELQGLWPKHARHILESHGNPVTGDIIQHGFRGVLNLKWKGVSVGEMALAGITTFDMITVGSVWLTTYDKIVKQEMEKHGNKEKAEREAARVANDFVAKTQPPRTQFQRPQALTGREGFKLLFPFSGQTMQNWQLWVNSVVRPSIRAISSGDWGAFFKGSTEYESGIAQRLALAFILPAMLMGLRARRRKPTKDELIKDIMFYPIASIPAVGGTLQYMFVHEADWAEVEMAHTRVVNNTIRALYDIAKAVTGDEKFDKQSIRNLEEALAIPFSVPTAAVRFTEETIKLIIDEDYKFDRMYVLKALSSEPKE